MAKWEEEGGQMGGGGSRGSSEIILGENFSAIGSNALSTNPTIPIFAYPHSFKAVKMTFKLKISFF